MFNELGGYSIPVLFHKTDRYKASQIINSGKLFLPLAETNASEREANKKVGKHKLYYLSFARNLSSGYIFDTGSGNIRLYNGVVIVFSKDKLQKQRGVILKPLDYWGPNSYDFTRQVGRQHGRGREQEDRLYSDKREVSIKDAIVEVIIGIHTKDLLDPIEEDKRKEAILRDRKTELSRIRKLVISLKKHKIPVVFIPYDAKSYTGTQDMQFRARVLKALNSIDESISTESPYPERKRSLSYDIKQLTELVYQSDFDKLSKNTRSSLWHMRDAAGMVDHFSSTMHNMRAGSQRDALVFDKLLKQMKAKSVQEFFEKLWDKWSKILDNR